MLSVNYLISKNTCVSGRIEAIDHTICFIASGLHNEKGYFLFALDDQGNQIYQKFLFSDAFGNVQCTIPQNPNNTIVCFLADEDYYGILKDSRLSDQQIRMFLHNIRIYNTKTEPLPIQKTDHKTIHTKVCFENIPVNEITNKSFRKNKSALPTDRLPTMHWPEEVQSYRIYFKHSAIVPAPLLAAKYWQFVSVPSSVDHMGMKLSLGKYLKGDKVRAIAKILESESNNNAPNASQYHIPGFQYKKTPDGRSIWINIQEI